MLVLDKTSYLRSNLYDLFNHNCPLFIFRIRDNYLFDIQKASAEMVKSCAVMVAEFVSRPTITLEAENMVKEAIDKVICQV